MKKILSLVLVIGTLFVLVGCENKKAASSENNASINSQVVSSSISSSSQSTSASNNDSSISISTTSDALEQKEPQEVSINNITFTVQQGEVQTVDTAAMITFEKDAYVTILRRKSISNDNSLPLGTLIGALMLGNSGYLKEQFEKTSLNENKTPITVAGEEGYYFEGGLYNPVKDSDFTQDMKTKVILFKNGNYIYDCEYFAPIDKYDQYESTVQDMLDSIKTN